MDPVTVVGIALIAVFSITSHEASHGFAADRLGDPTAREAGRLTLNPLPHIDLFFTILLPLFLILSGTGFVFGGAKPVPVNVSRLRQPRRDWALVGLAGPGMNLLLALGLAAVLSVAVHLGLTQVGAPLTVILAAGIFLNVLLAVFNLIPIPPLDGSRAFQLLLSGDALLFWLRLERWGLLLIVGLVFLVPGVWRLLAEVVFGISAVVAGIFGVWVEVEPLVRHALFGAG
jgi:Zn-dependent protease